MAYFTREFSDFFRGLQRHNNKAWFDDHRRIYEEFVRNPFHRFIGLLIERLQRIESDLDSSARESIFRINRDVRFSRDKRPYNTEAKANISNAGRRSGDEPGFYLLFSHDRAHVGGGVYQPNKDRLYRIRTHMIGNIEECSRAVRNRTFRETFGEVRGEKNKRLPHEFQGVLERQPLIANKGFWWMAEPEPDIIFHDDLLDRMVDYFKAGKPVYDFLKRALGG
jgi:uncharacterized protein (TIGR02453 family)